VPHGIDHGRDAELGVEIVREIGRHGRVLSESELDQHYLRQKAGLENERLHRTSGSICTGTYDSE
jgi:hypothetical protein